MYLYGDIKDLGKYIFFLFNRLISVKNTLQQPSNTFCQALQITGDDFHTSTDSHYINILYH